MRKKTNKIKTLAILAFSVFLFAYPDMSFPSIEQEHSQKKGFVFTVNEDKNFIFINLGENSVSEGDFVEVYRDSDRVATASVKKTMKRMSEASITKKYAKIDIGDRVVVTKASLLRRQQKDTTDTVAELREKIQQLEGEEAVDEKLKALKEVERLAEKKMSTEATLLEESRKDTVTALDKRLKKLHEKKEKTETKLDTRITSLKHAKESVKKGLVSSAMPRKSTIAILEEKLSNLEKSKKDTMAGLKKEIETLEIKKVKIKTPTETKTLSAGAKKPEAAAKKTQKMLDELEKKLKEETAKYESPESPPGVFAKGEQLSLNECISIAMKNHFPLEIAKKQLRLAKMRLIEAGRKMGPEVTAKWEVSDGQVSDRYYEGRKIAVEAKQPVFYGGELVLSVKQAKVNLEIVKNDYDRIMNELVLQVKKGYYNLDKAEKAFRVQEKLQAVTKKMYDVTKAGYDGGVIAQVEFLKVGSQHNQANFQATSAEEDISMANLILQQAMNVDGEVKIFTLAQPKVIQLGLQDCFGLAFLNRPEMKISHLALEHYEYEKRIMEARAHWPRVDLLGMYGNMREDYIEDDNENDPRNLGPEYYIGTKISVPLWGNTLGYSFTKEKWQPVVRTTQGTKSNTHAFSLSFLDKLEDFSGLEEAELEYMRSQDDLNKKQQEITLEVKEVFFKYKKALFLMDVAESKVAFQGRQAEIVDIRRELGEAEHSDVIEEMIKLAEEEYAYLQAVSDYYVAVASLNKAIGLDSHFEI